MTYYFIDPPTNVVPLFKWKKYTDFELRYTKEKYEMYVVRLSSVLDDPTPDLLHPDINKQLSYANNYIKVLSKLIEKRSTGYKL